MSQLEHAYRHAYQAIILTKAPRSEHPDHTIVSGAIQSQRARERASEHKYKSQTWRSVSFRMTSRTRCSGKAAARSTCASSLTSFKSSKYSSRRGRLSASASTARTCILHLHHPHSHSFVHTHTLHTVQMHQEV